MNPTASPKTVDRIYNGLNRNAIGHVTTHLGVYQLTDDVLEIIYSNDGQRPTEVRADIIGAAIK